MVNGVPFDFDAMRLLGKTYKYLPIVNTDELNVFQHIFCYKNIWHEFSVVSEPHYHDFYEIEVVLSGHAHHYDPLGAYDMYTNDYVLMAPNYVHDMKLGKTDPLIVLTIQFKKSLLDYNTNLMINTCKMPIHGTFNEDLNVYLGLTLDLIERVNASSQFVAKLYAKKAVEMLVLWILSTTTQVDEYAIMKKGYAEINKALDYIRDNFYKNLTINEVADIIGYSPNYFSHKFKNILGIGFSECLNNERMNYAYNQIILSNDSIKNISINSGFNDIKNFYKVFKHKYKITPTELREQKNK